jgi:protein translocase SecG subunit
MITFLLVVHALIAAALVTVILMQRSEGGGLGMGGGPAGLMTARGAADFLTRATSVLAALFVLMAFLIAALASRGTNAGKIDTSLAHQGPVNPITAPTPAAGAALPGIPMAGAPAPDPATAQALQPAAGGLPTAVPATPADKAKMAADLKAQAAAERANAEATRKAPTAANLKTIDTSKTTGNSNIGINGISAAKPATPKPAPAASAAPAPVVPPPSKPVPLTIAPPTQPSTGSGSNGATPQ